MQYKMNKKIALELYIHQHISHQVLWWLVHWSGEKCKLIDFMFNHHTIILGTICSVNVFFFFLIFFIVKYKIMIND